MKHFLFLVLLIWVAAETSYANSQPQQVTVDNSNRLLKKSARANPWQQKGSGIINYEDVAQPEKATKLLTEFVAIFLRETQKLPCDRSSTMAEGFFTLLTYFLDGTQQQGVVLSKDLQREISLVENGTGLSISPLWKSQQDYSPYAAARGTLNNRQELSDAMALLYFANTSLFLEQDLMMDLTETTANRHMDVLRHMILVFKNSVQIQKIYRELLKQFVIQDDYRPVNEFNLIEAQQFFSNDDSRMLMLRRPRVLRKALINRAEEMGAYQRMQAIQKYPLSYNLLEELTSLRIRLGAQLEDAN